MLTDESVHLHDRLRWLEGQVDGLNKASQRLEEHHQQEKARLKREIEELKVKNEIMNSLLEVAIGEAKGRQ